MAVIIPIPVLRYCQKNCRVFQDELSKVYKSSYTKPPTFAAAKKRLQKTGCFATETREYFEAKKKEF